MLERISRKDIVMINQEFDTGQIINESSLDFALDQANKSSSWLQSCAVLVRAVLIDHVFEEGNKRTAAGIIIGFFSEHDQSYDPEKVAKAVAKILLKNMTSLKQIEREVLSAIIR